MEAEKIKFIEDFLDLIDEINYIELHFFKIYNIQDNRLEIHKDYIKDKIYNNIKEFYYLYQYVPSIDILEKDILIALYYFDMTNDHNDRLGIVIESKKCKYKFIINLNDL